MKKREAQNLIEIALLASVIVVIVLSVYTIYNNQKVSLAKLSKTEIRSVNLSTMGSQQGEKIVPINNAAIETAGALGKMSAEAVQAALSKITYNDLKKLLNKGDNNDLIDDANNVLKELGRDDELISAENINGDTLNTLVDLLNTKTTSTSYDSFVGRFTDLLQSK